MKKNEPIAPFSLSNLMTDHERSLHQRVFEQAGMRLFPAPFVSALSIVSDLDGADRDDYRAYMKIIVDDLGLDFGDSFQFFHRTATDRHPWGTQAFLRYDGVIVDSGDERLETSMSFVELLREFHLGNLDHAHGISGMGPRVAWLSNIARETAGRWVVRIPTPAGPPGAGEVNVRANAMPVAHVIAISDQSLSTRARAVMHRRDAQASLELQPSSAPCAFEIGPPDGYRTCFARAESDAHEPPAILEDVESIEIIDSGFRGDISSICLLNLDRDQFESMLQRLCFDWDIRSALFTDHAAQLFINESTEERLTHRCNARRNPEEVCALTARSTLRHERYSVLGDDPASTCYALPALRTMMKTRFINPGGISGEDAPGFDPAQAIAPTTTRDGSQVYIARRARINIDHDDADLARDMGTRSFPLRLARAVESAGRQPGRVWPLYTHLGNVAPKEDRPDPYWPRDPFLELQDSVFGITSRRASSDRIWMPRASTLYDYLLIQRDIAPHVHRNGREIHIQSWHDETLDCTLPRSINQLHGQTFYVEDVDGATVFLDGAAIDSLVRNAPDETGRASVTIVGVGAEHIVFDDLDPSGSPTFHCEDGVDWRFVSDPVAAHRGRGFARIEFRFGGVHHTSWTPHQFHPIGCQHFMWATRRSLETVRCGFLIDTKTGGSFYFGDEIDAPAVGRANACAIVSSVRTTEWHVHVASLTHMQWRAGSRPGGPLPSHAVERITIIATGSEGDVIDLDAVRFTRPTTLAPPDEERGRVLAGRVAPTDSAVEIALEWEGDAGRCVRTDCIRDGRGHFAFAHVPIDRPIEVVVSNVQSNRPATRRRLIEPGGHHVTIDLKTGVEACT